MPAAIKEAGFEAMVVKREDCHTGNVVSGIQFVAFVGMDAARTMPRNDGYGKVSMRGTLAVGREFLYLLNR